MLKVPKVLVTSFTDGTLVLHGIKIVSLDGDTVTFAVDVAAPDPAPHSGSVPPSAPRRKPRKNDPQGESLSDLSKEIEEIANELE